MTPHPRAGAVKLAVAALLFLSLSPAGAQRRDDLPPPSEPEREAPLPQEDVQQPPQVVRLAPDYGRETGRLTQEAARRYAEIAANGGWPRLAKPLDRKAKGKAVADLRRRLAVEGYPPDEAGRARAAQDAWDAGLEDAVKRFQAHVGLDETGVADRVTLRELNVSPQRRARQLAASAARLEKVRFQFGARYVAVNIPGASVESVEDGAQVSRYTAIVGGKRDRSPQLVAKIVSVDINPSWTVPASIVRKEFARKLRRNPDYFAREHIRIFDGRGREIDPKKLRRASASRAAAFTFRQDPGPKNALGSIRLSMPNKHAVFLHDTPHKTLFERDYRFLSHGCVRVEGVYDLAAWLLRDTGDRDAQALQEEVETGRSEKIKLPEAVPVAWVYMTGWATADGPAHFRRDIYNLDRGAKPPRVGRVKDIASR